MARNSFFQFKQFRIEQDECAMKVCTDSCVLGAYAPVADQTRILDIGTGTGILSLMMAQRSSAVIDAVEIVPDAARQATHNIASSPWGNRIQVVCSSIQEFSRSTNVLYDAIVSNPPYYSQSIRSGQKEKSMAWHDETLDFHQLLQSVVLLLEEKGIFILILPLEESERLEGTAAEYSLYPVERLDIYPNVQAKANRRITTFSRSRSETVDKELILYEGHQQYTDQSKTLLSPYFLWF